MLCTVKTEDPSPSARGTRSGRMDAANKRPWMTDGGEGGNVVRSLPKCQLKSMPAIQRVTHEQIVFSVMSNTDYEYDNFENLSSKLTHQLLRLI